jgi:hypothetical protein
VVLDEFLNPYPNDGGCDEGPSYWGAAAASLYDNISLMNLATNNAFDFVYEDEKVKNMGKFIYRAQISDKYFLNFADADPQPGMSASMIYRYGKDIGDADMMKFGAYYRESGSGSLPRFHYFRNLFELFIQEEYQNAEQGLPLPKDVWLPDIQVMAARDSEGTTDGFFLAAKGGHNDESHNHNDIGNYVVYYDGLPLLIDVGRGTYTRKTFSDERYTIWYNRSDYHNLPTINKNTQLPGARYKAENVKYDEKKNAAVMSLDMASAYPEGTGVSQWNRTLTLNRGKNVLVRDDFQLDKAGDIVQHLMTIYPPEEKRPGEILVPYTGSSGDIMNFVIKYDPQKMKSGFEKIRLEAPEDMGIVQKWGDNIYRINFELTDPKTQDSMEFMISRQ